MTGHLTADIETLELPARNKGSDAQHLSKFTLGCNEGERVTFLPVEAWNMPHLPEYLAKGSEVLISGALKQNNWETDSGEKRSRIVLNAYKVEFLDPAPQQAAPRPSSHGTHKRGGKNQARRQAA